MQIIRLRTEVQHTDCHFIDDTDAASAVRGNNTVGHMRNNGVETFFLAFCIGLRFLNFFRQYIKAAGKRADFLVALSLYAGWVISLRKEIVLGWHFASSL